MSRIRTRLLHILMSLCLLMMFSSCVHQFPDPAAWRRVRIHVTHETEWDYHHIFLSGEREESTRTIDENIHVSRYIFAIYRKGEKVPARTEELFRAISEPLEFDVEVMCPAGDVEIRVWHDYVLDNKRTNHLYVVNDFRSIRFAEPFQAGLEEKDAFAGIAELNVPYTDNYDIYIEADPVLRRPLAAYAFVTTDIQKFLKAQRVAKGEIISDKEAIIDFSDLDEYTVRMSHVGYYPHTYSHFDNNPVKVCNGMSYEAKIIPISTEEALLCFDHLMVTDMESSAPLQIEIYNSKGELLVRSQPIEIPIKRSRVTVVRGEFLTHVSNSPAAIDPSFDGQINIEIF